MPDQEPTIQDVLDAINDYATHNDNQWARNEERWEKNEERWQKTEDCLARIEATMVTKDYLEEKLSDLRSDVMIVIRQSDTKLCAMVDMLHEKKVLSDTSTKSLLSMQPFPQSL